MLISKKGLIYEHIYTYQFFKKNLTFIFFEAETECEQGRGRKRERGTHRIPNRLQALSCQHRAWHRAQAHEPWDRDWAKVGRLTNWATRRHTYTSQFLKIHKRNLIYKCQINQTKICILPKMTIWANSYILACQYWVTVLTWGYWLGSDVSRVRRKFQQSSRASTSNCSSPCIFKSCLSWFFPLFKKIDFFFHGCGFPLVQNMGRFRCKGI